jgi:subtilisin-like proprotein convertase family protein
VARITQQRTRQAILVTEGVLDPFVLPDQLQLFDANGDLTGFVGVPDGGDQLQVLGKLSDDDYEIGWIDQTGTGGGGTGTFEGLFEDSGLDLDIPDNAAAVETPPITVVGDANIGIDTILILEVWIEHTYLPDCNAYLIAPDDTEFRFLNEMGDSDIGDLGTDTDRAQIWPGGAVLLNADPRPLTGTFIPDGDWSAMEGMPIAGDWKLRIQDTSAGDVGILHEWALRFSDELPVPAVDVVLTNEKVVRFHQGTTDGPEIVSIKTISASEPSNNGATLNAWPHAEWVIDSANTFSFHSGNGLDATDLTQKVITWGAPDGVTWREDCKVQVQSTLSTPSNIGTFDVGLVDEDGRQIFLRATYPGGTSGRIQLLFDDGTTTDMGAFTNVTLPTGTFWMVLQRIGQWVVGEIYNATPGTAPPLARIEEHLDPTVAMQQAYGVDFQFDVRPRIRWTPGNTSAMVLMSGFGLIVSGRQVTAGNNKWELWSFYNGDYDGDLAKRAKMLAGAPRYFTEIGLSGSGNGRAAVKNGRTYLVGTWVLTSGAPATLGPLPPWMRPGTTIYLWAPFQSPSGGVTGQAFTVDMSGNIALVGTPSTSGSLTIEGLNWAVYPDLDR